MATPVKAHNKKAGISFRLMEPLTGLKRKINQNSKALTPTLITFKP